MTRFDIIKNMNIEELAFFLCVVEMNDPNSIPNIYKDDVDFYIRYLEKDDYSLKESVEKYLADIKERGKYIASHVELTEDSKDGSNE